MLLLDIIGTLAFVSGIVFLLLEFRRPGLSKYSLVSYACFMLTAFLLAGDLRFLLLICAGLSVLYVLLLVAYRLSLRKENNKDDGEK